MCVPYVCVVCDYLLMSRRNSLTPKLFGIGVFPLIAIRGSETLTVGIGVFPLIVIRGSFIVFPLVALLFVMLVLYYSYRHLSSVLSSYSGKI